MKKVFIYLLITLYTLNRGGFSHSLITAHTHHDHAHSEPAVHSHINHNDQVCKQACTLIKGNMHIIATPQKTIKLIPRVYHPYIATYISLQELVRISASVQKPNVIYESISFIDTFNMILLI